MKKHTKKYLLLCSAIMSLGFANLGFGDTAPGSIDIGSTVNSSCTVVTTQSISFSAYNPTADTGREAQGVIHVTCTNGHHYSIALDKGQAPGVTFAYRGMAAASSGTINYTLSTSSDRSDVWGDGTDGSVIVEKDGTGVAQEVNIYGVIYAGQTNIKADTYADTVTITVDY